MDRKLFLHWLKDTIKKIFPPRVRKTGRDILYIAQAKRQIRPFLSPGVYRIHMMPISWSGLTVAPRFLLKIGQQKKGITSETARPGIKLLVCYFAPKKVFLTDKRAISLYENDEWQRAILRRIEKYIDDVVYPRSEFWEISVAECCTITDRIPGESCFDKKHVLYLAQELLRFAAQSKELPRPEKYGYLDCADYSNIRYHVQHGDVNENNVLWQDDTHYTFIDFDRIDVFPTFYDFFSLILSGENRGIEEFLNGYFDQEIADYMKVFGINAPIERYKDECMAAFLSVPELLVPGGRVARRFVTANYKKTWMVLAE